MSPEADVEASPVDRDTDPVETPAPVDMVNEPLSPATLDPDVNVV